MIEFIGPRAVHVSGLDGYHVNLVRADVTSRLQQYEVSPAPASPRNVWAGDRSASGKWRETAFLRFATRAAARKVLGPAGLLYPARPA